MKLAETYRKLSGKVLLKESEDIWYDDDGWNFEAASESGLIEFLAQCQRMYHELQNKRRGSYGISGDTLEDLVDDLNEMRDILDDIITTFERDIR